MYPRYADRAFAHGYARSVQFGLRGGGQQYLSLSAMSSPSLHRQVHLVAEYVFITDIRIFPYPIPKAT